MKNSPGARAALCALTTLLLTACTPTPSGPPASPTSTGTTASPAVSPSPTSTLDPEQAAAAQAVEDFNATSVTIASDPAAFSKAKMTEMLERSVGGDMVSANVGWFMQMKQKGYRDEGSVTILSTIVSEVTDDGRGREVHVTQCRDQSGLHAVDDRGDVVTEAAFQYPTYNLRQYSVRMPPGESAFRVFGMQTVNGTCP